ncbi:MAG: anti-sigma factor [Opitutae bacterium]|nr:anti-sigma factor [Opitutae bacterium]
MITERQEELAALHAFDLLEAAEKLAFVTELAANPELQVLVAQLTATAATLALSGAQLNPPAELKQAVLAACSAASLIQPDQPMDAKIVSFSFFKLIPWAAAATLALATAWFARESTMLRDENSALRTERQLAEVAYKMAQNQLSSRSLLAEKMIASLGDKLHRAEDLARLKVTALASLAGNTKEAQVIAVWDPEQQLGLLTMEKLPAIADTQDYQIWIVDPAYPNPVDGGVFHVSQSGRVILPFKPAQPVARAAAFAISLEKKGGVPVAVGPIVLLGK